MFLYSSGLRICESVNFKLKTSIATAGKLVSYNQRRNKLIYFVKSKSFLFLGQYFPEYKPQKWLFESEKCGQYKDWYGKRAHYDISKKL